MSKMHRLYLAFAHLDQLPDTVERQADEGVRLWRKRKSRRLADFLLQRLFELAGEEVALLSDVQRTASGRPFLAESHIDFNISHSGDYVAVIASFDQPQTVVGVDIEHPQKPRRFSALLDYYASEAEKNELRDLSLCPEFDSLEARFYLSWCLREAVLKSQGVGIAKLSEVRHSLAKRHITSRHCPSGRLWFYPQLPFFLAAFAACNMPPQLLEWHDKRWKPIENLQPFVYHVN